MEKRYIRKMRLNSQGYLPNGQYFGRDIFLYECWTSKETHYLRATDRQHAKEQLQNMFKGEEIHTYR